MRGEQRIVTIYTRGNTPSCRKARKWFFEQGIPFYEINMNKEIITKEELKNLLYLSENGLEDFLKKTVDNTRFENLRLSVALEYLSNNPDMLKTPIVCNGKCLHIGFSEETLRVFIPREYRCMDLVI